MIAYLLLGAGPDRLGDIGVRGWPVQLSGVFEPLLFVGRPVPAGEYGGGSGEDLLLVVVLSLPEALSARDLSLFN